MRHSITAQQIKELASQLDASTRLLTPADGDDYEKLIARWADNAVKRAVSTLRRYFWLKFLVGFLLTIVGCCCCSGFI